MLNFIKKYNVGNIALDLPYNSYIHELPLLSFSDFRNGVYLSLIFNYKLKLDANNMFNLDSGYKLNIQKRILLENNIPVKLIDGNGKYIELIRNKNSQNSESIIYNNVYTFNDESKRILRIINNTFEIENEDFSKEVYNSEGYLKFIYDKYGDLYLSFIYNDNNLLSKIIYNNKEIIINYNNNNKLSSIEYSNTLTTLVYNDANLTINHYSGVIYNITVSDTSYSVEGSGYENSEQVYYSKECTYSGSTITLTSKDKDDIIDTMIYRFPSSVIDGYKQNKQVEIENKNGVNQRIQFLYDKPLYSYEIDKENKDVQFYNEQCTSEVCVYKTLEQEITNSFNGRLKFDDGIKMNNDSSVENSYELDVTCYGNSNTKGHYLLTGWIKSESKYYDTTISVSNYRYGSTYEFYVPIAEANKWHFFAYQFEIDANYIFAICDCSGVELKDLKITFQESHIIDENSKTHAIFKENILIDNSNNEVFPFSDAQFRYETEGGDSGDIKLSLSDFQRYMKKVIKNGYCSEVYYNDGKNVITDVLFIKARKKDTENFMFLTNFSLGNRYYHNKNIYVTKIERCNIVDTPLLVTYSKNNSVYVKKYLNSYFDIVKSEEEGVITSYTRDKGLITGEEYGSIYNFQITYDENENKITIKDECSNNYLKTGVSFIVDPVWGEVSNSQECGVDVKDTYDGDMSTLLEKEFSDGSSVIKHLFGYKNGNLSSLSCDELNYGFEYSKDKLSKVTKFGSVIEEHTYLDLVSTSYYPSQSNIQYSKQYIYDKYNRLKEITGELVNTYGIYTGFNSDTGEPNSNIDNSYSKLIMSEDKVKATKSRLSYNEQELLKRKETTNSGDYSNKISDESFKYDLAKRLIEKEFAYNVISDLKVKDVVSYVKGIDDPFIDNRVSSNKYFINNLLSLTSTNSYDLYKRINKKEYVFQNNKKVEKNLLIENNKVKNEAFNICDNTFSSISYTYDSFDRVSSILLNNKTITYEYDVFGRVVRENNEPLDKTIIYEYNNIGNIVGNRTYAYTLESTPLILRSSKTYLYDTTHKDRLTKFNDLDIPYNTLGCPTKLNGYNLTWEKGKLIRASKGTRQLGFETYTYSYNAYGQRTSKSYVMTEGTNPIIPINDGTVTGYTKSYNYDHFGRLINEIGTVTYYNDGTYNQSIDYLYDGNIIVGFKYTHGNDINTYYLERNILGDVSAIYNIDGDLEVKYLYDAYGNCTVSGETTNYVIARVNPIRYRGYYYDVETGWFWLSSRYYSPELCRFISPDDIEYLNPQSVNGFNLYCYCYNNPINYIDPSGHIAFWLACGLVLGAIGLIGGGTYAGIKSYEAGNTGWDLVGDIALGAVVGGAAGFAAGALLGAGASILLTGSAGSAVGVVFNGAKGLAWAYSLGGPGAALGYCMNNIYSWWYGSSMLGYFPDGNGFSGPTQNITLQPGTIIQRFGGTRSNFVAPYYTDPFSLSLPYYQLPNMYNPNLYVVNQPINVIAGQAAPWFGQYGGGTQYVLPEIIRQLLESGAISPF